MSKKSKMAYAVRMMAPEHQLAVHIAGEPCHRCGTSGWVSGRVSGQLWLCRGCAGLGYYLPHVLAEYGPTHAIDGNAWIGPACKAKQTRRATQEGEVGIVLVQPGKNEDATCEACREWHRYRHLRLRGAGKLRR